MAPVKSKNWLNIPSELDVIQFSSDGYSLKDFDVIFNGKHPAFSNVMVTPIV